MCDSTLRVYLDWCVYATAIWLEKLFNKSLLQNLWYEEYVIHDGIASIGGGGGEKVI